MLRTNLSTRPFYNERAVHLTLACVAAGVLTVTAVNVWQIVTLSGREARLRTTIADADRRAVSARSEAARIRAGINPRELDVAAAGAREANAIIDRRAFSWTDLFNRFERTLPNTVRITSVVPRDARDGAIELTVNVLARSVEGIDAFIESLEADGAFTQFLTTEEFRDEDGVLQATLVGRYRPPAVSPPTGATP